MGLQSPLSRENLTCCAVPISTGTSADLLLCRWGKLAEGSTDGSDKCPHSVKHPQDFQQQQGLHYHPSQEAEHVGVIHIPSPTFQAP